MSTNLDDKKALQKSNCALLTKALTNLRKEKWKVVRLSKKPKEDNFRLVWELAQQELKYDDLDTMLDNQKKLIVCRKIYSSKTNFTENLSIHFNGARSDIVKALKNVGLTVVNENEKEHIIIVKLI